jgi:hypothetical protein
MSYAATAGVAAIRNNLLTLASLVDANDLVLRAVNSITEPESGFSSAAGTQTSPSTSASRGLRTLTGGAEALGLLGESLKDSFNACCEAVGCNSRIAPDERALNEAKSLEAGLHTAFNRFLVNSGSRLRTLQNAYSASTITALEVKALLERTHEDCKELYESTRDFANSVRDTHAQGST